MALYWPKLYYFVVLWLFLHVECGMTELLACPQRCYCLGTTVDCGKLNLRQVPRDLPTWVETLDLQGNSLSALDPESFRHLRNLQRLDLSNNRISHISPQLLESLQNLTELKLNQNRLSELPDLGSSLASLSLLSASHNELIRLNAASSWTDSLRSLDLSFNKIRELPAGFLNNATRLQTLNLSNNRLHSLDKNCFSNLTSLTELKLNRNRIANLSKETFKRLSSLKTLELNRNSLTTIDGLVFEGLTSLTALRLRRNHISQLLDGAFYGLTSIQQLELDFNNISVVTKGWLFGMNSLQQLSISNNRIDTIDKGAWEFCQQLWELDLTHNELEAITKPMFVHLPKLERLLLDNNRISRIEDGGFSYLYSLQTLELNNNQISWVIEDSNNAFIGLNQLTKLGLSTNRIKSVAKKVFSGLEGLKVLDLNGNNIAAIQDNAFYELKSLVELRFNSSGLLCDCQLRWFPAWLQKTDFATSDSVHAVCGYPGKFQGKSVTELNPDLLTCDDVPKPFITDEPKSLVTVQGELVTLTCKAESTSSSPMSFLWKKDDCVITGSQVSVSGRTPEGRINQLTSTLNLSNINETDAGRYQCVVSNEFVSTYSSKAKITVHVFPTFTKKPADLRVRAGQLAQLECLAEGSPAPEIRWTKAYGKDLKFPAASDRRFHLTDEHTFEIRDVKSADAGLYHCIAENVAGTVIANVTITVLETPTFVKALEDKVSVLGITTVLECMASGTPTPRIRWRKDGRPFNVDERHYLTVEDQFLVILSTDYSDAGKYECEITNPLGIERSFAVLSVRQEGEMHPEHFPEETWKTNALVAIIVVCAIVGTSLVWFLIIYRMRRKSYGADYSPSPAAYPVTFPAPDYTAGDVEGTVGVHLDVYDVTEEDFELGETLPGDNVSDVSEQCSSKDSGTGDSAKQSHSSEDVSSAGFRTRNPRTSLERKQYRALNTFVPLVGVERTVQPGAPTIVFAAQGQTTRLSLYEDRRSKAFSN